jgi:homoaconitate hydratase
MPGQNLVEKIAQRFAVGLADGAAVSSGDYLSISPAHVMTHDNSGAIIPKFESTGARHVHDPRQIVFTLDHNVQDTGEANLQKYSSIEVFAAEQGIDFYRAGRGIGHQIMCEEGYAWPGTLVVASDSHSNMYGGLGCLGTPIVRTDAAAIWATGRTWWQVPPVAQVELTGRLRPGATGKDVIITLCGFFNRDEVLNHAVEFTGDGADGLSISQRLTIANMTTEWGALAGLFPVDDRVVLWLQERATLVSNRGLAGVPSDADADDSTDGVHPRLNADRIAQLGRDRPLADPDAGYAVRLLLDLDTVVPHVAGPDGVKVMTPLTEIRQRHVAIDKAYLVSCVNSRLDDLAAAARVVKGHQVAEGVEFYIAAASSEVQQIAEDEGHWQTLIDAGARPLPSGCGPCIGLGAGLLEEGEVGISATNRNFKGRMGSRDAFAYLASPEVVAASAISGIIDWPEFEGESEVRGEWAPGSSRSGPASEVPIVAGFPATVTGSLIYCHEDNLNTDGIYPGKYTYMDDFTPEQQAGVVMENYDPGFGSLVEEGDILVGGFNFGTGSSREQAATALKHRGLALVLAGSFSETFKRNAINNGFLAIEAPELVMDLKEEYGTQELTIRTEAEAAVDLAAARVRIGEESYPIAPVGAAAQELIVAGGLEEWVRQQLT